MKEKNSDVISLFSFMLAVFILLFTINYLKTKTVSESIQVMEANIRKAAISCYAIEGGYPDNLEYLEKHYGLQLDKKKYVIEYDVIGSNVMPWIAVAEKGTYYFEKSWG